MAESQVLTGFTPGLVSEWIETVLGATARQIKIGAATIINVDVDNTVVGSTQVHVKLYFATLGSVVVGTTAPNMILPVPAQSRVQFQIVLASAAQFPVALVAACVQEAGTAGTTAPAQNVGARISYQ